MINKNSNTVQKTIPYSSENEKFSENITNGVNLGKITKAVVVTDKTAIHGLGHTELILVGENASLRCSYGRATFFGPDSNPNMNGKLETNVIRADFVNMLLSDKEEVSRTASLVYAENFLMGKAENYKSLYSKGKLLEKVEFGAEDISPKQGSKMFDFAMDLKKNPKNYNMALNNCVLNIRRILKSAFEQDGKKISTRDPIKKLLKRIPTLSKSSQTGIFKKLKKENTLSK